MEPPKISELKKITIEPTLKRIKSEGNKTKKVMTKHEAVLTMLDEIRKLESEKLALQNEVKDEAIRFGIYMANKVNTSGWDEEDIKCLVPEYYEYYLSAKKRSVPKS